LKYPKSEKSIFLKTLSTRLFLSDGCRFNKSNTLLINGSPEKSILNDTRNAIFLKSRKHTIKNASTNDYLTQELGLWLEKLHTEDKGQVGKYVNEN
jgi:hypothetical protein